jgi:tryptophan-rich sensory protein
MTTLVLDTHRTRVPAWLAWLGFVVLCSGAGFLSSRVGNMELYQEIVLPSWAPRASLFGPVWGVLYVLMGTAAFLIWHRTTGPSRRTALTVFAVQLALNASWTPVFFGLQRFFAALIVLGLVWASVLAMMIVFARRDRLAGALIVPLFAWVSFAFALNASIWWLNR